MDSPVTRLHDRQQLFAQVTLAVDSSRRTATQFAVIAVRISRFRRINLLHGYDAGDSVLRHLTATLLGALRPDDVIARTGDSSFMLLLPGIFSLEHARLAAHKILRLLEDRSRPDNPGIHYRVACGIAIYPDNALEAEELLLEAEIALDHARRSGQSIGTADKHYSAEVMRELDIETELQGAIDRREMELYFQPKISARDNLPTGAEALIRWRHPRLGLLPPDRFLPAAEATGLLTPITEWVLSGALRHSAEWTEKWGPLSVSVNIPTYLLAHENFVDQVRNSVGLWQRQSQTLVLEILESSLISRDSETYATLSALREFGVHVSIDDFGTGYSSLAYFRDLPADELKIDRSFIMDLSMDSANRRIVALIIELAHRFDLHVVAEGVETAEAAAWLNDLGCDQLQGHYFSRPIPTDDIKVWFDDFDPRIFARPEAVPEKVTGSR